jgi:DNA-directed RNA polymerase beta subunit
MMDSTIRTLLDQYFETHSMSTIQLESYDDWVIHRLPLMIRDSMMHVHIHPHQRLIVRLYNLYIDPPYVLDQHHQKVPLTPYEARIRDLTYQMIVYADLNAQWVELNTRTVMQSQTFSKVELFRIPVMVRSSMCTLTRLGIGEDRECHHDTGGYFIIKGKERVLITQERINYNQVYVYSHKSGKYPYIAELRSVKEDAHYSVGVQVKWSPTGHLFAQLPYISQDIPLGIVFCAMGVKDPLTFFQSFPYWNDVRRSCVLTESMTSEDALQWIGQYTTHRTEPSRSIHYTRELLTYELFPHLGPHATQDDRIRHMAWMMIRLLRTVHGDRPVDERDHISNKRIECAGDLLGNLLEGLFKRSLIATSHSLEQKPDVSIPVAIHRSFNITHRLLHCFTTGNWGIAKTKFIRSAVSQVLSRLSYTAMTSSFRRVVVPVGKDCRNTHVRQLHCSTYGFLCPVECFDPSTLVRTWSGEIIRADQVQIGMDLINDQGFPTKVTKTCAGLTDMYRVTPTHTGWMSYTVTSNHILTLKLKRHKHLCERRGSKGWKATWFDRDQFKYTTQSFSSIEEACTFLETITQENTIDLTVDEYFSMSKSTQSQLVGFKCPMIHWPTQPVSMDPYRMGAQFTDAMESSIVRSVHDQGIRLDLSSLIPPTLIYSIHSSRTPHIPWEYICNDRSVRLALFAGWIDHQRTVTCSNGHLEIRRDPSARTIFDQMVFVAQSLGWMAYVELEPHEWMFHQITQKMEFLVLHVWGETLTDLPSQQWVLSNVSDTSSRSVLETPIHIESVGTGPFVGWQLEGNGRFLLSDCTVVHNTPEGASSGIIKNVALLTDVSHAMDTVMVEDILRALVPLDPPTFNRWKIILNGNWIAGVHSESAYKWAEQVRSLRRSNQLPWEVSVSVDPVDGEIMIACDPGRLLRPLFRVYNGWWEHVEQIIHSTPHGVWEQLVEDGSIVYIDGKEAEQVHIAMTHEELLPESMYCEIHPSLMLGMTASLTPFPDHSQAPRNIYHAAMSKQGIGLFATNLKDRFDTITHVLHYPQEQLVQTHVSEWVQSNDMPSGINCVVAVMAYGGWNQEDSIILNRAAIDRGLFRSTAHRCITASEVKRGSHDSERIELPPIDIRQSAYNYTHLDPDGVVRVGTYVTERDVLVAKVYYSHETPTRDCSVVCKLNESGYVEQVCWTRNASGYPFVKVKLRSVRIPEMGDKFVSYEAQKGTAGFIHAPEDMPFTADGMIPDIIINPNAFPSRMTINMLLELLSGKAAAMHGDRQDATAFCHSGSSIMQTCIEKLEASGLDPIGWETMYNGMTGEPFRAKIYVGIGYYQRLKHLVAEKIHARSSGNVHLLTRQPCAGRSRDGGLRFGEMERDCMIAHGTSTFLKERLADLSDPFTIDVCANCGQMVSQSTLCRACQTREIRPTQIPYACKLLFQELQAMNIKVKLST